MFPVRAGSWPHVDIFELTRPARASTPDRTALRPAGLARRLAALCYDLLLLTALLAALTLLALVPRGGRAIEPGTAWFSVGLLASALAFFAWFWTHGGQTLGMAAWLSLIAVGLGFVAAAFDTQRRTWHDRLAGTIVVRRDPREQPAAEGASAQASNGK
jgi:uncharacterized RDD family membrane protein YckC